MTRRCALGRLLLRPCKEVDQIFLYCLAVAAARTGVIIHAYCVEGTHYHLVVTDPEGRLPVFLHWLNRHVALCIKELWGWNENVWAVGDCDYRELITPLAVLDAVEYVITNCVKDGLVASIAEWPGVVSRPHQFGGTPIRVARPKYYFRSRPEQRVAQIKLVMPKMLAALGFRASTFVQQLRARIRAREQQLVAERQGKPVLGAARVLAASPFERIDIEGSDRPKRRLHLKAVLGDALRVGLAQLREFRTAHRIALARWRRKEPATFPAGTWWMRVFANAPTEPDPPIEAVAA